MSRQVPLLAVPNISEGRDAAALGAITKTFTLGGAAILLDRHSDPDHHRAVVTVAGQPGTLEQALVDGAAAAVERIDVMDGADVVDGTGGAQRRGEHPHVGAVDVMPLVYLDRAMRGAACAEALVVAERIGTELEVPVFLYGELASGRVRATLRRGGPAGLRERMAKGEMRSDFGPPMMHPTAGATLVAAREPLVAFNLELAAPATVADARRIAALIREGGEEGLPGLRAIGVTLSAHKTTPSSKQRNHNPRVGGLAAGHVAQVSMNVERPLEVPLRAVVEAVGRHAQVVGAELVGLAPRAALEGFPADIAMPAFDPRRQVIENVLEGHQLGPSPFQLGL